MENTNNINEMVLDTLIETNTNWTVQKKQLVSIDGYPTNKYGVFRNDNNNCLGVVGESYQIHQNHQLLEDLYRATESIGLSVNNGGDLNQGRYIFYQIALPEEYIGNSGVKRNVTALNSHDGTKSLAFGFTNTVIICQNTFFKAHTGLQKVKHTKSYLDKIDSIIHKITDAIEMENTLIGYYKMMEEIKVEQSDIKSLEVKLFGDLKKEGKIYTEKIDNFYAALDKEFNDEGKTLWGLFNGVTRYTNHYDSKNTKTDFNTYIMNGTGSKINNLAYSHIAQIVDNKNYNDLELVHI